MENLNDNPFEKRVLQEHSERWAKPERRTAITYYVGIDIHKRGLLGGDDFLNRADALCWLRQSNRRPCHQVIDHSYSGRAEDLAYPLVIHRSRMRTGFFPDGSQ